MSDPAPGAENTDGPPSYSLTWDGVSREGELICYTERGRHITPVEILECGHELIEFEAQAVIRDSLQ